MSLKGIGPAISTFSESAELEIESRLEGMGMDKVRPAFAQYAENSRRLRTLAEFPTPEEVTSTDPAVLGLIYETPGVEPDLAFTSFVRGAAVCGVIVVEEERPQIQEALIAVAESIIQGAGLPSIDLEFANEVLALYRQILANGEASSWRPLTAFMLGAFWILGYVEDPTKQRKGKMSPLEFVKRRVARSADLGYVPQ